MWKNLGDHYKKIKELHLRQLFADDPRRGIILGRGEDDKKVREWLTVAAVVPGFIGFAVGRTSFWDPLVDWRAKKITRHTAVAEIARRYQEFVGIFETREKGVPA